jgi:hypothetical protein
MDCKEKSRMKEAEGKKATKERLHKPSTRVMLGY